MSEKLAQEKKRKEKKEKKRLREKTERKENGVLKKKKKSIQEVEEKSSDLYNYEVDRGEVETKEENRSQPVDQQVVNVKEGVAGKPSKEEMFNKKKKEEKPSIKILYNSKKPLENFSIKPSSYSSSKVHKIKNYDKNIAEIISKVRKKLIPLRIKVNPFPGLRPKRDVEKSIQNKIIDRLNKKESEKKEQEAIQDDLLTLISPEVEGKGNGENLWDLIEWDRNEEKMFSQIVNSKESLFVFLIGEKKKFPLKKLFIRILSTEFKRKYSSIESSFELEDFSDKNILVQLIHSDILQEIISRGYDKHEFQKRLDDIMTSEDMNITEGKLIMFDCVSLNEKDIKILYQKVSEKFPINTIKLRAKYEEIPDYLKEGIIRHIKWMLSILSYKPGIEYKDINKEFDELLKVSNTQRRDLILEEDWGSIAGTPSGEEGGEHLILKLLAFKKLKEKFDENQIEVEVVAEEGKYPDLRVHNEIWVEIETLLGLESPNFLIPNKISKKKDAIKNYREFWLILPNFEIFIHKRAINALGNQLRKTLGEQIKIKIFGVDYLKKTLIKKIEK